MRLFEIENNLETKTFDEIWYNHIVKDCSDIINVYHNNPNQYFYRGYVDNLPSVFRDTPRPDRKPKDSMLWLSQLFDLALHKLGFKALRSNRIFVSSSLITTKAYGTPYFIFPVNGFDYTYTKWRDIILYPSEAKMIVSNEVLDILQSRKPEYYSELLNAKNKTIPLDQAMDYINEAFAGKITLKAEDIIDFNSFEKEFVPSNTNIVNPLQNRHEVCILGSYYAINYDTYEAEVKYRIMKDKTTL